MGRSSNQRISKNGYRDAKAFIIATEGTETEPQYFHGLRKHFRNPRINPIIIPSKDGKTSPSQILENLDKSIKILPIKRGDELWLVTDRDNWKQKELSSVAQNCHQRGINLALSNPCFELWLLLHLVNLKELNEVDLLAFCSGHSKTGRDKIKSEIRNRIGSYNKSNIDMSLFIPNIEKAIEQAKTFDNKQTTKRWPDFLGTRVYRLVEKIIR